MRTILDAIIEHKRMEVLKRKSRKSLETLRSMPNYSRTPLDPSVLFPADEPCIIAEYKRKSPSKGVLSEDSDPVQVVTAYRDSGAAAASILTDRDYFGGSFKDLENVRNAVQDIPLLRKDFLIDEYQVHEAKAYGADIILLIAAVLGREETTRLSELAASLGLTVLLEVHSEKELDHWNPLIKMVGVNNRDLKSFTVDLKTSRDLVDRLPAESIKVTESGLRDPSDIHLLFRSGYRGFLIGERFMSTTDPGAACETFMKEIKGKR